MPGVHAKLSASGSELWLNCPGSVHMREQFPEKGSSVAAQEGTIAHAMGAFLIDNQADLESSDEGKKLLKEAENFYEEHPELTDSVQDMASYMGDYSDFVLDEYTKAKAECDDAALMTEQRIDYSKYVKGGFGTSDVIIIYDNNIEIIDLKYGKGVPITAVNNPQIRIYALGALEVFGDIYDFETVRMIIYQPRLSSITEEQMTVKDLLQWAKDVVAPGAKKALAKTKTYNPGPWCTSHFCPGAAVCKKRAEYLMEMNRLDDDPATLSREEIGAVLARAKEMIDWVKKLEEFAFSEAEAGHKIPGWKIVEGKSNRKYADEGKVEDALIKAGFDKKDLFKAPELLGITAMEKLVTKKKFKEILTDKGLVIKPQGKPTLAPDDDDRPEFVSIKSNDFDE